MLEKKHPHTSCASSQAEQQLAMAGPPENLCAREGKQLSPIEGWGKDDGTRLRLPDTSDKGSFGACALIRHRPCLQGLATPAAA